MGVVNTQVIDSCRSILRIGGLMVITGSRVWWWFPGSLVSWFCAIEDCTCCSQTGNIAPAPQVAGNRQVFSPDHPPLKIWYKHPKTYSDASSVQDQDTALTANQAEDLFTLTWELNATNLGIHWIRFHDRRTHTIGDNLFVCCLYCWLAYVDFQQKQPVKCSSHTYIIIPTDPYAVEYVLPIKIFKACIVRIGIGWTSLQIIRFTFWNMLYWVWLL